MLFSNAVAILFHTRCRILRSLCVYGSKNFCYSTKQALKPCRPISLEHQSVLLPGPERIRSSVLLEDPNELVYQIPGAPHVKTVFDVLDHGLKASGDGDCIGSRIPNKEEYKWLKYSEVIAKSQYIGSGLIELGIKPCNDSFVGMFAENREEFLLTLYGCAAYSIVLVPLYLTFGVTSLFFVINQAKLSLVVVNSVENALKLLQNVQGMPSLRTLVLMDPLDPKVSAAAASANIQLVQFSDLQALGRSHLKDLVLPMPEDLFCIPYTSGTTGVQKGVMLTHKNIIACIAALIMGYREAGVYGGTIMSFLPPAHIYEIANEVGSLFYARRIAFYSGDIKKLLDEMKYLKPTVMTLVPRMMNAIYANVMENIGSNPIKSALLQIGLRQKEKLIKRGKMTDQTIWDKLVFRKLQQAMGGNIKKLFIASAPVSPEVMRFFRYASGAYVFEAYGQTETMASTMTLPQEYDGGFVGPPLPSNYIKLSDVPEMGYFAKDDIGEVCIKGQNVFKGYFKNEEATNESLKDGWQHTGDIGKWLPNGTLKIIDRKKHLFKLSQGEYIAPEKIEAVYSQFNLISQVYVDGFSTEDYTVVFVVPEMALLEKWLKSKGYTATENMAQLLSKKEVRKAFLQELQAHGRKKDLNSLEQAKNMTFLLEPFTIENEILTPTFKIKRNLARKRFESQLHQLYKEGPLL